MALATNPVTYGTWNQFKDAFEKQFIPPAAQMEAIQKMHDTQMGTNSFATWFQEWSTQAQHAGVNETTKMWAFRCNLPSGLQAKLLMLSLQPTTLDTLVEKVQEFNCNWQIFGGSSGTSTRGWGSSQGNWHGNQNPRIQEIKDNKAIKIAVTQPHRGTLRKRGKLMQQEQQCCMANKLCLYCSQPGHMAASCPISHRPYLGTSVRQLGMTPEDKSSLQTGIGDLNINAVAAFNVINKMIVDTKTKDKSF